jgi:hypothetical protein
MSVDLKVPQIWQPEIAPQDPIRPRPPPQRVAAIPTAVPPAAAAAGAWSLTRRLAFRFVLSRGFHWVSEYPLNR